MKNWEILCFYDDEIIAEHEYETLEKAREIFQKLYHMFITTLIQKMAITERCY